MLESVGPVHRAITVEHLGGVSDAQGSLGFPCGEGQLGLLLRARQ